MSRKTHEKEAWKTSVKIKKVSYYYTHPIYDLYAANKKGKIINVDRKAPMFGSKQANGYMHCCVRSVKKMNWKKYLVHRFVWECYNGIIPEGMVIDHINDIKDDNRLSNLQLLIQKENCKKSARNRDYSFVANIRKSARPVKATNIETKITIQFKSIHSAGKELGISVGVISQCCQKINYYKSGYSKIDGQQYKFEYVID